MFCEFDKCAAESYCAVHGVNPSLNIGDITKVNEKEVPDFNTMVGGSPCFVSDTLILTDCGYKRICDLSLSDRVLTDKNEFMPVRKIGKTDKQPIYRLTAQGILPIKATYNHPFYVKTKDKNVLSEPFWNNMGDLKHGDYIAVPILSTYTDFGEGHSYSKVIPKHELSEKEAWVLGRYIADGYIRKSDVVLCIGKDKTDDIQFLEGFDYSMLRKSVSCFGCHIKNKKLLSIIREYRMDRKAHEKEIPPEILYVEPELLKVFLDGYFSGDGCVINNIYQATTVSQKLAFSLSVAIQKAYGVGCRIYFDKRPAHCEIEGRIVNQRDTYMIRFNPNTNGNEHYNVDFENMCVWYPIKGVVDTGEKCDVYNIEVDNHHTYIAGNAIVHNCQDFSVAGKQGGTVWTCKECEHTYNPLEAHFTKRDNCPRCGAVTIEKNRSSLIVEWLRFLREKNPRFAIYENVKNIVGSRFRETFDLFIRELEDYGYNVYWKVLNAKHYGIPQNRERVYCFIIRKDLDNGKFKFPEPIPLKKLLRDMLEDEVDERYYLDDSKVASLILPPDKKVEGE